MELQIGDIIGYKPKATASWLAALIKIGGKLRYSHVMMYIGSNRVIEATAKGIKIDTLWVDPNDTENIKIIRYKEGLSMEEKEKLLTIAYGYQDIPYDKWHYPLLFLHQWFGRIPLVKWIIALAKKIDDKEYMNCSEFVDRVYYEAIGIDLGDEESPDFTLPDDIMDNPDFVTVN